MIGESLGPYKILEALGAGGMGEVYLGEDTRLGRKVAIKVLPAEFATEPERLARFEQEAKAAAALNHPHIAVVHDIGSEAGSDGSTTHFMVQEYLEGETLREPLKKGALPLGKALLLAREVAEALHAAHGAGIVHRDLKPDNVFVTKDGHAKVLDFGLAKLTELAGPGGKEISMSPTVLGTVAGQIMGTAGYMAPEQVEGDGEVDPRADLFAFGCVLYEMVGGKRAFGGESVLDTLHAIARSEPQSLGELDPAIPADLERIITKCLAKDRERRYQHADDVLVDLKTLAAEVEAGTARSTAEEATTRAGAPPPAPGISWKLAVPVAAAIALAAVLGTWVVTRPAPPAPAPIVRFFVPLPDGVGFSSTGRRFVAVSPGGTHIVFSANGALWLRPMDGTEAVEIRATSQAGATNPFFSPDGEYVGYWANGEILKVAISGGAAVKLCDAGNPFGAHWGDDGYILYGQGPGGIWRVPEDGGEPEQLIEVNGGGAMGPQTLPGSDAILYTRAAGSWTDAEIVMQSPDDDEPLVLVRGGHDARYLATGHIVYALGDTVFARPFDVASGEVGGAVSLAQGVASSGATGASQFAISGRGDLFSVTGSAASFLTRQLVWRDPDGSEEVIADVVRPGRTWTPRLSPDGRYVAYRVDDDQGERNIWLLDLERGIHSLFTPDGGARSFAWSPDGEWLYYSSDWDGDTDVYRRPADMRSPAEELLGGEGNELVRSISPDGAWLLYADTDVLTTGAYDIEIVSLTEPGDPRPVFDRSIQEVTATFSPNGKWVAFVAAEEGAEMEVYVQSFPNLGGVTKISDGLGTEPLWSPDSSRLYYRSGRDLMVVDVVGEDPFDVGPPQLVRQTAFLGREPGQNAGSYDISRDGRRLLMITVQAEEEDDNPTGINVVLNWFQELRQRVPNDR